MIEPMLRVYLAAGLLGLTLWFGPAVAQQQMGAVPSQGPTDFGPQPSGPYEIQERWGSFQTEGVESDIRYYMVKPKGDQAYPGIYYIYGRPGLDDRLFAELQRLASFGFTVVTTHFQEALLIPVFSPQMDPPETVRVQSDGYDEFLKQPERAAGKVCIVATVRGGYYALKLVTRPEVACWVGIHPVLVDHSEPEQYQEITIMPEIRKVKIPTLLMVGDADFEVRTNQSRRAARYLETHGVPIELVVYPSAARGFDFRTVGRTMADDLAKMDSMYRTVEFLNRHLGIPNPAGAGLGPLAAAPVPTSIRLPFAAIPRKSGRTYLYRDMTE
jgi:dienelactone hydrolase